ncbi:unnamed protein product [Notodromas monacha]|uniref:Uncharacterized protein n=1 Tax=Notodromas monacha TaxID=399045 RepID=A0A7R9BV07_9CRUS|nr:unnamed protein product [Notodromas monacha]CAG0921144.1 unnamed protein product [Notodromas monacha]
MVKVVPEQKLEAGLPVKIFVKLEDLLFTNFKWTLLETPWTWTALGIKVSRKSEKQKTVKEELRTSKPVQKTSLHRTSSTTPLTSSAVIKQRISTTSQPTTVPWEEETVTIQDQDNSVFNKNDVVTVVPETQLEQTVEMSESEAENQLEEVPQSVLNPLFEELEMAEAPSLATVWSKALSGEELLARSCWCLLKMVKVVPEQKLEAGLPVKIFVKLEDLLFTNFKWTLLETPWTWTALGIKVSRKSEKQKTVKEELRTSKPVQKTSLHRTSSTTPLTSSAVIKQRISTTSQPTTVPWEEETVTIQDQDNSVFNKNDVVTVVPETQLEQTVEMSKSEAENQLEEAPQSVLNPLFEELEMAEAPSLATVQSKALSGEELLARWTWPLLRAWVLAKICSSHPTFCRTRPGSGQLAGARFIAGGWQ